MIAPVQPGLFDIQEGKRRRDAGRDRAASGHHEWLEEVRKVATWRIRMFGEVTSDDIRAMGYETPEGANPNAIWGSIFADPRFRSIGYQKSTRPEAHARPIQRWVLSARLPATASNLLVGHLEKEERGRMANTS